MFLHRSVILFAGAGGCLPQCMLGYTPPLGRHPLGRHPTPWADTPLPSACWDTHTPLPRACCDRHGYCCGRYALYWNTFLLNKYLVPNDNHKINKNWTSYNNEAAAKRFLKIRMHSSRMRTARFSTDQPGGRPPERTWDQTGSDIIPPRKNMGPERK